MSDATRRDETRIDVERRSFAPGRPKMAGVPVRDDDVEPTRGLTSVAILFRVLAGLLGVIIVLQLLNAATSSVSVSYGVLLADVIRLVIFAGLLWGAGDVADLLLKSHHDLRASRILLGRLTHQVSELCELQSRPAHRSGPGAGEAPS